MAHTHSRNKPPHFLPLPFHLQLPAPRRGTQPPPPHSTPPMASSSENTGAPLEEEQPQAPPISNPGPTEAAVLGEAEEERKP